MPLIYNPRIQALDANGDAYSGAKMTVFDAGTVDLRQTFSDIGLTTPNANPLIADSAGIFGPFYLAASATNYKLKFDTAADVNVPSLSQDNIPVSSLDQATIGLIFYPEIAAETAASATIVNFFEIYGKVARYGTNTTPGTTDMTTAINTAETVAGADGWVDFDGEIHAVSTLAFTDNVRWRTQNGKATIKASNAGAVQEDFITITGSVIVDLVDIIFDGNVKVDKLVKVVNAVDIGAGKYVSSRGCIFKNTDTNTRSSAGLRVEGGFDYVYTDPNTVFENMNATGASSVSRGLAVVSSGAFYTRNTNADRSYFDDITPVADADAIFAEALTGTMNESHLSVVGCTFRDCAKRVVKSQTYSSFIHGNHIERTLDHSNTADPEIAIQAGGGIVTENKFFYSDGAFAPGLLVQLNNTLDADTPTGHLNPSKVKNNIVFVGNDTPIDHFVQINTAIEDNGNDYCEVSNNTVHGHLTKFAYFFCADGDAADIQIDELLIENNYVRELSGTNFAFIWGSRFGGTGAGTDVEYKIRVRNNVVGNSTDAPGYYNETADTAFTTGSSVTATIYEWLNNRRMTVPESAANIPATVDFTLYRDGTETATGTFTAAVDTLVTDIDSNGGAVTCTLPDGVYEGQRKVFTMSDATASSTVSATSHETSDPEVFTFAQTTDYLVLEWSASQAFWWTVKNIGVAV